MDGIAKNQSRQAGIKLRRCFVALLLITLLSGCGTAAQMLYFIKGDKVKAAYGGLKSKKVAVVFESDATSYGPNPLTEMMANMLAVQLKQNVKNIELIPVDEIQNWKDENAWEQVDYVAMGNGLDADMVVAVEVSGYSIHEGPTVFKGRSSITTKVYDIEDGGNVSFVHGPELFEFPKSHARPAIGTTDAQFEMAFVTQIVQKLTWLFADHEKVEGIASDAWMYD